MNDSLTPIVFCIICFITGGIFGGAVMLEATRQDAIKAGAAHWSVDPKTGEKTFVFQPPPTKAIHNE